MNIHYAGLAASVAPVPAYAFVTFTICLTEPATTEAILLAGVCIMLNS